MNLTLRAKLLILFFFVAIGPLLIVGIISYYNSLRSVEAVVQERATSAVQEARTSLQRLLESRKSEFNLLVRNQEIQDLYALRAARGTAALDSLQPRLETFFRQFFTGPREGFAQLYYLDLQGNLVFRYARTTRTGFSLERYTLARQDSTFSRPDMNRFQEDRTSFSTAYLSAYGPVLQLSRWIKDAEGRRLGFLLADLEINRLFQEARFSQASGTGEYLTLIDRSQNRLLFHSQTSLISQTLDQTLSGFARVYDRTKQDGWLRYQEGEEEWLVSYLDMPEVDWTLAMLSASSQFTGPVRRAGLLNLGITLAAIALALVLIPLTINPITASIRRLTQGAEAIAAGDLDQQISVTTRDETRTLALAFNRMAHSLKTTLNDLRQLATELEDRVRRRTADLDQANQRLLRESAAERVRSEALSMRSSEDLRKVVAVMWQEMVKLGVETPACSFQFIDEEADQVRQYIALENPRKYGISWTSPEVTEAGEAITVFRLQHSLAAFFESSPTFSDSMARWHKGETWSVRQSEAEIMAFMKHLQETYGFDRLLPMEGDWVVTNVPFQYGTIGFRERQSSEKHVAIVQELTSALELAYTRYIDFQAAEERSRQQARQAAVERVRAEALSMRSGEDLPKVVAVMFRQMRALGVETPGTSVFFANEETDEFIDYLAGESPATIAARLGLSLAQPTVSPSRSVGTRSSLGYVTTSVRDVHVDADTRVRVLRGPLSKVDPERFEEWRRQEVGYHLLVLERNQDLIDSLAAFWEIESSALSAKEIDLSFFTGQWHVTRIPFAYGTVSFRDRQLVPEHTAIARDFTEALELGYLRFLDFQRLEAQNRALEEANARIQEANRLKSQFLANMSHELRTPMNAIVGFSKIVHRKAQGLLPQRQMENLERILQSSEILLSLINDILDLSKIEAGRLEIQPEDFSLHELVKGCINTVAPMAKPGVELRTDLSPQADRLHSDPSRVRQVLINLLSNAAKFTAQGSITVAAQPVGPDQIELSVADTGIGIPPEALEFIFEEFRQVDGSTTRKYGGTGLGLSISRKLTRMLGGDIRVESQVGKGSTFIISLPVQSEPAATATPASTALAAPSPDPARRLILSIDDDPDVLSLIAQELEEEGYQVLGATRALEGIDKARQLGPCAITLDIMMPGMDGWEAISRLKSDPTTRDIPLIVVSIIDNKELGFRLGADEYLLKPIDKETLLKTLRRFEGRGRQVLVADDDPAVVDLVRQLLEEEGWQVRSAANGRQALDQIARSKPDVLLLDLMMPVMDGFETLHHLRENPETRDLPVVVITAKDLTPQEREDLRQSTVRVIQKDGLERERILRELRESLKGLEERKE